MNKKLTSLALAFLMIFSLQSGVLARDFSPATEKAEALNTLGLFAGTDTGFELERVPNRLEAITMLVHISGADAEVKANTYEHPFTDVPNWADPYVGYAYENKLTSGSSATTFGTGDTSAAMYLTFMLRALGYSDANGDFTWNNPYALATEVNIFNDSIDKNNFLRADVVLVSSATLLANPKGETESLGVRLMNRDVFTQNAWDSVQETLKSAVPALPETPNPKTDFSYNNLDDGTWEITDYLGTSKVVNIPSKIDGIAVTRIGEGALSWNNLTSVTIPNSVTQIGEGAFWHNNLTSVTIPNSVTSIGVAAFSENSLTSVTIPNSVTSIIDYAFSENNLTNITIPNSVTQIGAGAFADNSLTSVTIPNFVTRIDSYAFISNNLTSITIPNSVTSIGYESFSSNNLTSITIPNSVTSFEGNPFRDNPYFDNYKGDFFIINNWLLDYKGTNKTPVIPNSVTSIGEGAFSENNLTNITIPNSVTHIGSGAFAENSLTNITIPNFVTRIGDGAFSANKLTSVTIPNSVTSIGDAAFSENSLTSVTIPNFVTSIGFATFANNSLTSITIPNSVTHIGDLAFYDNHLTSVTIPNSVTDLGPDAFDDGVSITRTP